ncbi:MAG: glycosyltransferase, partial [Miltoncostaeaceae bacterium]
MTIAGQGPVAWMMSRFPAVSETFILQEVLAAQRAGVRAEIFPLVRQRGQDVHPEARPLVARAHYARPLSLRTLGAQGYWLRRAPARYLGTWARALAGNIRSPRFALRALVVIPLAARFAREMQGLGVRHVHAHWATHPALAAWAVNRLTGIPYSVTAHAHDIYVDRSMLGPKLAAARRVVTISEFNREFLAEHYPAAVDGRLDVVRCGIDLRRFPLREQPGRSGEFRILCVAGLRDYKGHEYLIRAVALMGAAGVPARLELIGDGPMAGDLHALCRAEGVADRVDFRGARSG